MYIFFLFHIVHNIHVTYSADITKPANLLYLISLTQPPRCCSLWGAEQRLLVEGYNEIVCRHKLEWQTSVFSPLDFCNVDDLVHIFGNSCTDILDSIAQVGGKKAETQLVMMARCRYEDFEVNSVALDRFCSYQKNRSFSISTRRDLILPFSSPL